MCASGGEEFYRNGNLPLFSLVEKLCARFASSENVFLRLAQVLHT